MRRAVDVSEPRLGLILLGVSLGALPAMIVTGRILDRVGPRIVPLTAGAFAVAGALPALARSPWALFALLLVVGAATGAFDVAINARANAIEAAADVRVMDGLHAAFSAGVVVGGISAGLAGLDQAVGVLRAGILVAASRDVHVSANSVEGVGPPDGFTGLAVGIAVVGPFDTASLSDNTSTFSPGMFAAAMVTGRLLAQRTPRTPAAARMAFAGTAAAVGLAVVALAHGPLLALAGFVVTGLGLAVSAPTLFRVAGRLGAAPAISTVAVLGYLGFVVGPPLFGAVAGASSVRGGFVFLCAAAGVLVTTAPILRRREIEYSR